MLAVAAIAVAVGAALGGASVFDDVKPYGFQDPGSESERAYSEVRDVTGHRAVPEVELLVQSRRAQPMQAARRAAHQLRRVPGIALVLTPHDDPQLISSDRRRVLVLGFISADITDISEVGADVKERFSDDRRVSVGGAAVTVDELTKTTQDDLKRIELFALPLLLLLSLLVFRGLVAALLPVVVGALSILTTLALLNALTTVIEIDTFAINIVTGLGLGLAIDYSLFLVTRFRQELEKSTAVEAALSATTAAIGRMIVFSGLTVAVSLIALCVFPQRFLYSIGVGGALVALASAAVCLLLLPAFLALLGQRVNALAPPALQGTPSGQRWFALARFVLDRPLIIVICSVALMVAAGLPFLRVELTQANAKILPKEASARQVEDVVAARFEDDPADRVVVVVPTRRGAAKAARSLRAEATVTGVLPRVRLGPRTFLVLGQIGVDQYSDEALDTVREVRAETWAQSALIGGPSAELVDQRASLGSHIPLALAIIVLCTVLILFLMTRSVVLPLLALLMNTLTVSVAFGVLVLVFQDGRFEGLLDYTSQGGLDTSMPILLFAVVFGLSTDYGVFLLQQIAEARRTASSEDAAIAGGVVRSGRMITAAAILFAVAMGAFAFSELVFVKEVAVGAAVAVLVDATIVRAFLFPAMLGLLAEAAWWCPKWLGRRPAPELS